MRDPYSVLGVAKSASEAEIKKAFRQLAKKHHPDTKGGDETAQKKFQEISAAYDILGDKEKRAKFDRGEIDANGNPSYGQGFQGSPFGQGGAGGTKDFHFTWANQGGDTAEGFRAEDIFADLFGGGRGRRNQARRGEDFDLAVTVSFSEAALGATRRVTLPDGRDLDVRIPTGLKDGQQIRLKRQAAPGTNGGPAGDVLLTISVAPHPYFVRDGNDLRLDLPITLKEAVLGGKVTVPTLTGHVALTVPPNSNSGAVLRLKGKGVPGRGSSSGGEAAGDLYVKLVITLPDKPDAALNDFVSRWQTDYDPRAKLK
ncbi:MAG TPA: J domain-containing protein [Rhizomicrobium sp.]|nr:J domain-containing protein [Rhizomicrobium sp.]